MDYPSLSLVCAPPKSSWLWRLGVPKDGGIRPELILATTERRYSRPLTFLRMGEEAFWFFLCPLSNPTEVSLGFNDVSSYLEGGAINTQELDLRNSIPPGFQTIRYSKVNPNANI